ncbi:uncharacterized protein Dwil_GK17302 [Drosophila willistoni]|uniref:Transmembrane protein n=1 Tax=Drosophila willistoni TaxID=7260 RepID=B4NQ63_DROWI|nr:uncharacterized protein LOC6653070 [Drosophila willistoni]EDW86288.1 uncharacterized protein Dwil_GK17302 [Drosophila willistoni]
MEMARQWTNWFVGSWLTNWIEGSTNCDLEFDELDDNHQESAGILTATLISLSMAGLFICINLFTNGPKAQPQLKSTARTTRRQRQRERRNSNPEQMLILTELLTTTDEEIESRPWHDLMPTTDDDDDVIDTSQVRHRSNTFFDLVVDTD